jgi:hypothetical protein
MTTRAHFEVSSNRERPGAIVLGSCRAVIAIAAGLRRLQDPELRTAIADIFACEGRWYWRDRADD